MLDRTEDEGTRRRRQDRVQRERNQEYLMGSTAYKKFWKEANKCTTSAQVRKLINQTFDHWYRKETANSAERRWMGAALGHLNKVKAREQLLAAEEWKQKKRAELEAETKAQILKDYGLAS